MKPFRARSPLIIGAVSIAVILGLMAFAFNIARFPAPIGGGTQYKAQFADASGLKPDDQVQVAGVKVGKVGKVELQGDHVDVSFRIAKEVPLGQRTRASIRIRTLLGLKYLSLEPDGSGKLDPKKPIPVNRTVTPFDVVPAFQGLGRTAGDIDPEQLAKAFSTISDTFRDTPDEVKIALDGLSRFSQTIASRDAELATLLQNARGVTDVLAERDQDVVTLLRDGNRLFQAVNARRDIIRQLLIDTQKLSTQLQGLVADNRGDLQPALDRLQVVTDLLQRNQNNLATTVQFGAAFARLFSNTIGTGQWFDTVIQNIAAFPVDAVLAQLPDALLGGVLGNGGGGGTLDGQGAPGAATPGNEPAPGAGGLADLLQADATSTAPAGPLAALTTGGAP